MTTNPYPATDAEKRDQAAWRLGLEMNGLKAALATAELERNHFANYPGAYGMLAARVRIVLEAWERTRKAQA